MMNHTRLLLLLILLLLVGKTMQFYVLAVVSPYNLAKRLPKDNEYLPNV